MDVIRNSIIVPSIELHTPGENGQHELNFALARIKNTPSGEALLREITKYSQNTKQVRIIATPMVSNDVFPELSHSQMLKAPPEIMRNPTARDQMARQFALKKGRSKGEGASARIIYNRSRVDISIQNLRDEEFIAENNEHGIGLPNNDPTLFNNLVHAMRILKGTYTDDTTRKGIEDEEARAIGAGSYEGNPISENAFRQNVGLPIRAYYSGLERTRNFTNLMKRPGLANQKIG